MGKLTGSLIVGAIALGVLAVRNAGRAIAGDGAGPPQDSPASQPGNRGGHTLDEGMVIRRNEPIDNGIAVHSPFQGDPGIVAQGRAVDRD